MHTDMQKQACTPTEKMKKRQVVNFILGYEKRMADRIIYKSWNTKKINGRV